MHKLGPKPWRLPPLATDAKASMWPGSGATLYKLGQRSTKATLEQIAAGLNLIEKGEDLNTEKSNSNWWERLLPGAESDSAD